MSRGNVYYICTDGTYIPSSVYTYGIPSGWKYDYSLQMSAYRQNQFNKYVSTIQRFLKKAMFRLKMRRHKYYRSEWIHII